MPEEQKYVIAQKHFDAFLFWGGVAGWSPSAEYAYAYATHARASIALRRNRDHFNDTAAVMTRDDAIALYDRTLPDHVRDGVERAFFSGIAKPCEKCDKTTVYRSLALPGTFVSRPWCGCGYVHDNTHEGEK